MLKIMEIIHRSEQVQLQMFRGPTYKNIYRVLPESGDRNE